ncbi:MAG: hypothetical protein WCI03_13775 [bacterium]
MKTHLGRWWVAGVWMLVGVSAQAAYIDHHFDADPFTNGAKFVTAVQQWQASDAGVMVVNTKSVSPANSVLVPAQSALTNAVAVTNAGVVWTDLRITPFLGVAPDLSATNGSSIVQYFGADGYLVVWTNGGWLTCSNDVWGQPVAKVTTNAFAAISVYQNYTAQNAAILVNDQVVVQDLPFLGSFANYGTFEYEGADGNAWLDDVRIQAMYDTGRHFTNSNGVDGIDAAELESYGYVARTQYVGSGSGYPRYNTIQAALNAWRARDSLYVYSGQYAENVTVYSNVTFGGQSFTNSGSLTIAAGAVVAFQNATVWSNITIGANSQVVFSQPLQCSNLTVSAGATVTFGGSVTVGSATVLGSVLVTGASTVTVATVLSVPNSGSGHLDFSGGRLLVTSAGVDMSGTFSITNTWGTQATAGLDFVDDFELYAHNSPVANLGFRGWGASSAAVLVKTNQGVGGSRGVVLPDGAVVSNRINSASQKKVWTDYEIRPTWGLAPTGLDTNSYTFMAYVGTNGFLNVWNAGSWTVCSNYLDGNGPVTAMATDSYTRVSVFLNYDSHLAAVYIGGNLVLQQVPFPAGGAISNYNSFEGDSLDGSLALDNIRITTGIPSGLSRAEEIQINDALMPLGSVFKIR